MSPPVDVARMTGPAPVCSLPRLLPPVGLAFRSSYEGDCRRRPAGAVRAELSDGYIWLLPASIEDWDDGVLENGRRVTIAPTRRGEYRHVPGTDLVRFSADGRPRGSALQSEGVNQDSIDHRGLPPCRS